MGLKNNLRCPSHWKCKCDGEWGGICNNQHFNIDRQNWYLKCPKSNPNQCLCLPAKTKLGVHSNQVFGRVWICLIQILKQGLLVTLSFLTQARSWIIPAVRVPSRLIWAEGLAITPGRYGGQQCLSSVADRVDCPQSKANDRFEGFLWYD